MARAVFSIIVLLCTLDDWATRWCVTCLTPNITAKPPNKSIKKKNHELWANQHHDRNTYAALLHDFACTSIHGSFYSFFVLAVILSNIRSPITFLTICIAFHANCVALCSFSFVKMKPVLKHWKA